MKYESERALISERALVADKKTLVSRVEELERRLSDIISRLDGHDDSVSDHAITLENLLREVGIGT